MSFLAIVFLDRHFRMTSPTVGQVELRTILMIWLQEIYLFMKIHPVKKTVGLIMKQKMQ